MCLFIRINSTIGLILYVFINHPHSLHGTDILPTNQDIVEVASVTFDRLEDDWIQAEISLRVGNKHPSLYNKTKSHNPRYVDAIELTLILSYESPNAAKGSDYYRSTVAMPTLKRGPVHKIYFYLPGSIVKRDRLPREPDMYLVQISVNGLRLPTRPEHGKFGFCKKYGSIGINHYLTDAHSQAPKNDGVLLPQYHAPLRFTTNLHESPPFIRRDP